MSTIDHEEVKNFTSHASQWWDETGVFKPLHKMNPIRIAFIKDEIITHFNIAEQNIPTPLKNLSILDVGCGGGLLCEPLARLGATVVGVDAGQENINIAQEHAKAMGLDIEYICTSVEELAKENRKFDVVTALEIVEHVADVDLFLKSCCELVGSKDTKGLLILSTLNRTLKSYALGIVAAEHILRWVPKGTHQWNKFLEPAEVGQIIEQNSGVLKNIKGMSYNPLNGRWSISDDLDVNYLLSAEV